MTEPVIAYLRTVPPCTTRNERGWQMVRGGNGPLFEFASEQEVAKFFGSRMIRQRW